MENVVISVFAYSKIRIANVEIFHEIKMPKKNNGKLVYNGF